jgi:hypothetical protein
VEEAVLVEADVHEGRLEPGQDVVDLALVDVADDRAASLALDVQLSDSPVGRAARLLLAAASAPASSATLTGGASLRLEDGHSGFATVDRDEHLLSQKFFLS